MTPSAVKVPTILVTGPVGVGKTTLINTMGHLLGRANVPHATVDFDQLTACFPRPADDDIWGTKVGLANLAAIWRNYHAAGAERLLLARVIEARSELDGYRAAVPGAEITVVRLRASVPTLQARLRKRGNGAGLQWHLDRAVELAPEMDRARVEDLLVETEERNPSDLASEILLRLGWLHGSA
jgi:energy-coupling factor transporter ATP-binding protein EcfA2